MSDDAIDLDAFPEDRLYAPEQDMWVRPEKDGTVVLGATHLVASHGQFMYFTPRPVGTQVARDQSLGVMETAKTLVAVHAPLSGEIVAVNAAIVGRLALIEEDPYGEGWMFRFAPSSYGEERKHLMDALTYRYWLAPRLAQKQGEAPLDDIFAEDLSVDPNRGY